MSRFRSTKDDAKKIGYSFQLEALKMDMSLDFILSVITSKMHLLAYKACCSLELIKRCSDNEAYGLSKKLSYDDVKQLCNIPHIEWLLVRFSLKDVLPPWFTEEHVNAVKFYRLKPEEQMLK